MYISEAVFQASLTPGEYFYVNQNTRLLCYPGEINIHMESLRENMEWEYAGIYITDNYEWIFKGEEF